MASGLNIAAFNIGIALGSIIGGQTVEHFGLTQTPWIGAVIVLVAFLLIGLSGRLDKPARVARTSLDKPHKSLPHGGSQKLPLQDCEANSDNQ